MAAVKAPRGIDTHAHVFSAGAPAVPGARYRPQYAADLQSWRSCWPDSGITHGVVVQPSFFGADNREMLDTIASQPDLLRGVAVVPANIDEKTLKRFHATGVRAARLNLRGVRDYGDYASRAWRGAFERMHDAGWHVECFIDTGRLPDIAAAFQGTSVDVVFDHFGAPGPDGARADATFKAVEHLARDRAVWVKLSAPYRLESGDAREHAKRWFETVGPSRLVWGSDWPWTGFEAENKYRDLARVLHEWIDPALVPAVLWDNPARLYGFD